VYHHKLGFLNHVDEREIYVRTSTETRTHQVSGALLYGMDATLKESGRLFKLHTQPSNVRYLSSSKCSSFTAGS
jgi:2-phosphoxylose phosphatase